MVNFLAQQLMVGFIQQLPTASVNKSQLSEAKPDTVRWMS